MNKIFKLFFITLFSCMAMQPVTTFANSAAGGELIYEWLSDSTYRFYFKFYRDCTGAPEPLTQPLCFLNTCNNSSFTLNMANMNITSSTGTNMCGYKNKCDSAASTIPGYRAVWYNTTVTMPSRCAEWRVFTYVSTRNNSTNLLNPLLSDMYVEAMLNNTGSFQGNSSPYFSVVNTLFACNGVSYTYNPGAVDPNLDSLVTEIIQPRTGVSSCSNAPINAPFSFATPSYNITNNPFQTGNSFYADPKTGQISFVPQLAGTSTLAIRVKEYRGGVLIGSIMREMPVNIMACNTPSIAGAGPFDAVNISFTGFGQGIACVTLPFSVAFDIKSPDPNAKIVLTDNHASISNAMSVVYLGQNSDSVRFVVSWMPGLADSGLKNLKISIADNTCYYPGVSTPQTFTIPIYVHPATVASPDSFICAGNTIKLNVSGGSSYLWTVVNGTPNSLSNSSIADPVASPIVKTTYAVLSQATAFCPLHQDTITVDVLPLKNATLNLSSNAGGTINKNQEVIFTATSAGCDSIIYQWQLNGIDITGADSSTWVSSNLNDMDTVTCMQYCIDTCGNTTSAYEVIHVANYVKDLNGKLLFKLYPNPNNGAFTMNGYVMKAGAMQFDVLNAVGQVVYKESLQTKEGLFEHKFSVQGLPGGLYLLRLKVADGIQVVPFTINK